MVLLKVNLSDEVAEVLKELAARHGNNITDEIRMALSVWKYVDDELQKGHKLLIERKGSVRELIFNSEGKGNIKSVT